MKCRKKYIKDPYTRKCLKLSLNGTLYHRYVIPYLLGHVTFLDTFSINDQRKFLVFLEDNMLLSTYNAPVYSAIPRSVQDPLNVFLHQPNSHNIGAQFIAQQQQTTDRLKSLF